MKWIIFFSVILLLLVAPAWGAIVIKLEQVGDTNEFKLIYDMNGEPNRIRAFGLDTTVDNGATIGDANWLKWNSKYQIYPGQIDINDSGIIEDYGTPVCDPCDLPAGTTLPGLDSNGVTIEMGSLYVGEANAPASSGTLLSLYINCPFDCNLTLRGNTARTGTGSPGVVMEDPDQVVSVIFKVPRFVLIPTVIISGTVTCDGTGLADVTISGLPGAPVTNGSGNYIDEVPDGWSGTATPTKAGPTNYTFEPSSRTYILIATDQTGQDYVADCLYVGRTFNTGTGIFTINSTHMTRWVNLGKPDCWCCESQKRGNGVYTPSSTAGKVDAVDLARVKNTNCWGKSCGQSGYTLYCICSDVDLSCKIDAIDLARIKNFANWAQALGTCPIPGLRKSCP